MTKRKITVEFKQTMFYQAEIEVSEDEYSLLKEVDGSDLWENDKHSKKRKEAYHILVPYHSDDNVFDWDNELKDFAITQDENEMEGCGEK